MEHKTKIETTPTSIYLIATRKQQKNKNSTNN